MKKTSKKKSRPSPKTGFPRRPGRAILARKKCDDLFELTNDLIQIFKPEGTLLDVNPSWKKVLDYSEEDLTTLTIFNIIHPRDKQESEEVFRAVFRDGKPRKLSVTLIKKTGGEVLIEGTVSSVVCKGRPTALRGIFWDVTRHKEYEELKDEFISTVSHELRTPLTVVREGVSQMRDGLAGEMTPDQNALLDMVLQNVDRLARIIEELLDVSKLEAGQVRIQRTLSNIVDVVRGVVENFRPVARRKNLEIHLLPEKEKIDIYIDREKIVQVLTNLINNAFKFTIEGHVKIHLRELEDFVECKVADTGRGISKLDLPKAFEKFRQFAKVVGPGEKGTGLGLSICKKLIQLHHGQVTIESLPMKGTVVTFLLPKYTPRELFKESITLALNKCQEDKSPLSVIIFDLVNFDVLKKDLGEKRAGWIVSRMERLLNESLRRAADVAIKDSKAILVILPDTKKENAYIVLGRLYQLLQEYLSREQRSPKIEIHSSVACFPEEADTIEKLLDQIYD
ncbi:MAG TPA: ATP-binding protein [Candidatus Omnitrophota bacterium]|nr:ATP-binding protein [Candidatus Omnitrophota bacterium]HPS36836.1 ATP-binding protein [Candidatus Omnitrophota bacterium]